MTTRVLLGKKVAIARSAPPTTRVLLGVVLAACTSSSPGPGDGGPDPGGGGPLRITTPPLVDVKLMMDNNLQYQFMATGGTLPYSWRYSPVSESRLPAETSLSSDGVLSGTPCNSFNDGATLSLIFTVTDKAGLEASLSFLLQIECS